MAKIYLNIEAEDAADLRSTLETLTNTTSITYAIRRVEEDSEEVEPDAGATQDAEPGERQARKRRTKAEMAADAAAQTAPALTAAPGASASQPSQPKTSGSDVFGDQLKEVTSGALTLADVEKVGREAFEKIGAPAMQAILMDKANGAKSFKQVEPQFFEAVHAALVEAAGE